MKFKLKDIILIGIFAAITAICSQISFDIPFSPVAITLQVFSVCLSASILGSKLGTFSQIVYLLIGMAGAPVFSHFRSGLGFILGPSGGYLISFPIAAFLIGFIIERNKHIKLASMGFAMAAGLIVTYVLGTAWLGISLKLTFEKSLVMGIGWYLPLDVIKIVIAAVLGYQVRIALIKANLLEPAAIQSKR